MRWPAARGIEPERTILVTGHGAAAVAAAAHGARPTDLRVVHQAEQLGTGHAVLQAAPELAGFRRRRDRPLRRHALRPPRDAAGDARRARAAGADVVVLGFEASDPGGYGRLVLDDEAGSRRIVEARDADAAERAIRLCNSGLLAADAGDAARPARRGRHRQRQGRILPDRRGQRSPAPAASSTAVITCPEAETLGINSRADLAAAEAAFQARARAEAMENGATLTDPATVWFALDTVVGRDVVIGPERGLRPRGQRSNPGRRSSASATSRAATSAAAPASVRSPGCGPAPRSARTCISATSSR